MSTDRGPLRWLDKALLAQQPLVAQHVQRLKKSRPRCTPDDLIRVLEKQYIATLTGSGAALGAAAAAPGVGTGAYVALSGGEAFTSLEATVLYILAVAEVHGVAVHEIERRRTLVMAILLGESGTEFVQEVTARTGKYWANRLVQDIPMSQINKINRVLGPRFITKYGTKQGVIVLGRALPFGIGVCIGAGGNYVIARGVVAAARRAFGPPPGKFRRTRRPKTPGGPGHAAALVGSPKVATARPGRAKAA